MKFSTEGDILNTQLRALLLSASSLFAISVAAHIAPMGTFQSKPILADAQLLKYVGIPILYSEPNSEVAYAVVTPEMEQKLSKVAHSIGRCGGFESLERHNPSLDQVKGALTQINNHKMRNQRYAAVRIREVKIEPKPTIQAAVSQMKAQNLQQWVEWMSKFPTRYNRAADPNVHVRALVEQLKKLPMTSRVPIQVDLINHKSTKQQSIRVHIQGSVRPQEVVVLGAHFDSITMQGGNAPGADDNASGSANLLEALRVLVTQEPPARSVEFFWYAGEESGLLGSSEIAETYKRNKVNVIAALQLDMTLHPGSGRGTLGLMTDYTSPWLRDVLRGLNTAYVGAKVVESRCGYGCSDHASWYRQGYPAVIPFESTYETMNQNIHSSRDIINTRSDFEHSLLFSKLALALAMELGNSEAKQIF